MKLQLINLDIIECESVYITYSDGTSEVFKGEKHIIINTTHVSSVVIN